MPKNDKIAVLSGYHLNEIMAKVNEGAKEGDISLNLGISKTKFYHVAEKVVFPEYNSSIDLSEIKKLLKKRSLNDCFTVNDDQLIWIYSFSDQYGVLKLYEPKVDYPPTLFINGSYMHAIRVSKPTEEAFEKAKMLKGVSGNVLDTCFGLGYSTIQLRKYQSIKKVVACEISPEAIEIAKVNPWSNDAFMDKSIDLHNEDVSEFAKAAKEKSFDGILHDPPNFNKFEYLYSESFYSELCRILKPNGKLYHFIGTKGTGNLGIYRSAKRKLQAAGFSRVTEGYRGLIAIK
ncbi:SAM-dependent methyltransferase [Candidatus Mancarchaeum acidiphilum]|uniref:SAM-dependent methyltransferase n=1 Tax=Candidatus Mancarchaeum acidiphilum TaxID=1920749 RepID=A0A218NMD1_9ARCH|nr:methyltransferase domain-containing protein [Candidatus Mancarchaeum acidiphilum]ASI13632.1 SAM-dependent methyltransferase [Candidatus Mancarchaeum acidiphilum]